MTSRLRMSTRATRVRSDLGNALRLALVLSPVLSVTITACTQRTYERDAKEIALRYAFRYTGECSAWLTSNVTGYKYCSSPAVMLDIAVEESSGGDDSGWSPGSVTEGATDLDGLRAQGEIVYTQVCAACHQASGEGMAGAFPPLAGAGEFYGDPQNQANIIVNGLQGEIVVKGETYNGAMPPQGNLTDYEIASVATFVRTSWGNDDGIVMPSDVAAVR